MEGTEKIICTIVHVLKYDLDMIDLYRKVSD